MVRINSRSIADAPGFPASPRVGRTRGPGPAPREPTNRGSALTPGPLATTSMPPLSTARSSAAIRGGSTRPATARTSASSIGAGGWIDPTAAGSRSTCGPTSRSTTRWTCARSPASRCPTARRPGSTAPTARARSCLHFRWMRQYGIDGVFLSRFIGEAANPHRARHVNTVLAHVREGCHREGRVWAMMLDLSMGRGAFDEGRQGRLEIPVRPGEGPRGFALPAPPGEARGAALGARLPGPPLDSRAGQGAGRLLQERSEVRRRLPDRRRRPLLADAARRIPPGCGLDPGLSLIRRHQPLGRRPISRRRLDGPYPQGGLGARPGRPETLGQGLHADGVSRASPGTTSAARGRDRR